MSFVHLHVHSEYSMLDSTVRVAQVVERAKVDKAPAVALTDHNNMFGAVDFFKAAKKAGVRAIFGAEVNLVPTDRKDENLRKSGTILLLCRTLEGYRNLCFLLSRGYMDTPSKAPGPRIDRPLLEQNSKGLLALTSSLSGEIPQARPAISGELPAAATSTRRVSSPATTRRSLARTASTSRSSGTASRSRSVSTRA
ncbi:MAG TPA: PHP domain-containing protein [Myxococcota bacterium]|nr:PHP domain-containing protein [Myxococcota bacterium]